ncbi:MAG: sigma-70 family RNA polymerase sigma factor [Verrucomicrobiae bacterium]|nr:sigma-70 family RNA polymerase sigma factor [Verrucomicrobiae bacterium]
MIKGPPKDPPEEGDIDEAKLVRECQQGKLESYEPLVKKYQSRICAQAYHFVRNEAEAEELGQMVFVKAWAKIKSFNGKSSFYTWLYRLSVNTCLDYIRKKKRQREEFLPPKVNDQEVGGVENLESTARGPDQIVSDRELGEAIQAAIKKLSPDHQAVIVLREIQGLSYEEMAQALGCSVGTVMSRLFYARQYLRKQLGSLGS